MSLLPHGLSPAPAWLVETLTRPAALPFTSRLSDQEYPPADVAAIEAGCSFLRRCRDEAPAISQWEWRQALSVWGRCADGEALAHARSRLDLPRYTGEGTAQALRAALQRQGPVRCAYVEAELKHAGCLTCPHHGQLVSPIALGRTAPRQRAYSRREAPPPGVGEGRVDCTPPHPSAGPAAPSSPAAPPGQGPPPEDGAPHPGEAPLAQDVPPEEHRQQRRERERRRRKGRVPVVMTAEELLAKVFPEPRDVLPQMVPEGLTLLVGRSKLGKSILLVQGAIAIATGGPLFGKDIALPAGRCLYLDLENGERRVQKRVKALVGEGNEGLLEGRLHVSPEWPGWQEGGLEYLRAWLETHPDTRLIVIDTLKRVRPGESGNKRLYDLDYDALAPLADLAHAFNVAIVVIHHTRKADASDILDMASGSTGLVAAVDTVLIWRRKRGHPEAKLYLSDRDRGEVQHAFSWNAQLGGWGWSGSVAADLEDDGLGNPTEGGSPGEVAAQVLTVLEQAAVPLAPAELAAFLHKSANALRVQCFRMKHAGQVGHVTTRETESGTESGSFYTLPAEAAAPTDAPPLPTNGVMRPPIDPPYQIGEASSPSITRQELHRPGNAPVGVPSQSGSGGQNGPALHVTASGTRAAADYLGAGVLNRRRGEEAVLALAAWRKWGGLTLSVGGFGFPAFDPDAAPSEDWPPPEVREVAWRVAVADASPEALAEAWALLWSQGPPVRLAQWAPPTVGGIQA